MQGRVFCDVLRGFEERDSEDMCIEGHQEHLSFRQLQPKLFQLPTHLRLHIVMLLVFYAYIEYNDTFNRFQDALKEGPDMLLCLMF